MLKTGSIDLVRGRPCARLGKDHVMQSKPAHVIPGCEEAPCIEMYGILAVYRSLQAGSPSERGVCMVQCWEALVSPITTPTGSSSAAGRMGP